MLIQYTQISSLDAAAQNRLKQAASGLLQTNEASQGYVLFEGHYISASDVRNLVGSKPQILKG